MARRPPRGRGAEAVEGPFGGLCGDAPAAMILDPVGTEPVKEILSRRGWLATSAPTWGPPVTMFTTPAGSLSRGEHRRTHDHQGTYSGHR
jgi:hypothetical protein